MPDGDAGSQEVAPIAAAARLLDYGAASIQLGCTERMVRKLVETRQMDSVKVGRLVRIEPAAIGRYIDAHRRGAVVPARRRSDPSHHRFMT